MPTDTTRGAPVQPVTRENGQTLARQAMVRNRNKVGGVGAGPGPAYASSSSRFNLRQSDERLMPRMSAARLRLPAVRSMTFTM